MLKRDPRTVAGLLSRRRPWWGGWWATRKAIYTLGLELENPAEDTSLRIICISYSAAGTRLGQKDIGILSATWPVLVRHFKPMRGAASFNIAIYKSADHGALKIKLSRFQLMQSPLDAIAGDPPEKVVGFEQGSLAANAKAVGQHS